MSMKSAYQPRTSKNYELAKSIAGGLASYYGKKVLQKAENKILRTVTAMATPKARVTLRNKKSRTTSKKSNRKRRGRKPKASLKKQVTQIKKQLNAGQARHVYKNLHAYDLSCAVNSISYSNLDFATGSQIETYMANLRYYDPAAPGTLVTAAAATGTYQRDIHFKNIFASAELRNNYQVPVNVKVYLLQPKGDTDVSPATYYSNAIVDQLIGGAGTTTTAGIYPTDLSAFVQQWRIKCVKDVTLEPGHSTTVSHSTGSFTFDPALYDHHTLAYQNKFKSFSFFVRLEGVVGHDTTADQQTTLQAAVDCLITLRAEILYDAGVSLDDIYLYDQRAAAFTNGGVVSLKPVADNIGYSKA